MDMIKQRELEDLIRQLNTMGGRLFWATANNKDQITKDIHETAIRIYEITEEE